METKEYDEYEKSEWYDYENDSDDEGKWFKGGYNEADEYNEDTDDWEDDDKDY